MKRIATHKRPDADALVATWLAERYLFAGDNAEIVFVSRHAVVRGADCVVDLGNTFDPDRLRFDHKPPAFTNRNATCATRLLWEHLVAKSKPVVHLEPLIRVVHEGDRNPPGKRSPELSRSKTTGFHAHLARLRAICPNNDAALYAGARTWLNEYDRIF